MAVQVVLRDSQDLIQVNEICHSISHAASDVLDHLQGNPTSYNLCRFIDKVIGSGTKNDDEQLIMHAEQSVE